MKTEKQIRNRWLNIRLSKTEYEKMEIYWKASTCRQLSQYARTILQKKPVIILYRNASADEILSEMIRLKNELNAIGKNFNQVVHKLHTLDHVMEILPWLKHHESVEQNFMRKVEEIRKRMQEIHEQWSQK